VLGKTPFWLARKVYIKTIRDRALERRYFPAKDCSCTRLVGLAFCGLPASARLSGKMYVGKSPSFLLTFALKEALVNVLIISSWLKEKDILLTMATLSRGTLSMYWSVWLPEELFLVSQREKGSCAGSRGLELSSYKLEIQ